MPVKPPRQFCGEEHWSTQPCAKCDKIKRRPEARAKPACSDCADKDKTIASLRETLAGFETAREKERVRIAEAVKKSRDKKKEAADGGA